MTTVRCVLYVPTANGDVLATGDLYWSPTAALSATVQAQGTAEVLPAPFHVALDGATVPSVTVDPTGVSWCWKVVEAVPGYAARTRYVQVPASGTVDLGALVDVDPTTLAPAPGAEAAWTTALNAAIAAQHTADSATYSPLLASEKVYRPEYYGAARDGVTDDYTAVMAAITAAYNAGGGTVLFWPGTYLIGSQIVMPNDAATLPKQAPIRLLGSGARWDGAWQGQGTPPGCTILDLRSTTAPAKIETHGLGLLAAEHLVFTQAGSAIDSNPFIHTTNTTLIIRDVAFYGYATLSGTACIQDAIVLGGTSATQDGTTNGAFRGYGTLIESCYFARIRRGVYGRAAANSVRVHGNTFSSTCGSDNTAAAIQFDGTVDQSQANIITGNLFEVTGYVYVIRFTNSGKNYLAGNSFWDENGTTLACHYLEGASASCSQTWIAGQFSSSGQVRVVDATAGAIYTLVDNSEFYPYRLSGKTTTVQPYAATGSESTVLFRVLRSGSEVTNPGTYIMSLTQAGSLAIGGPPTTSAKLAVTNGTAQINLDSTSLVKNSGHLDLYGGSGATDMVRVQRGPLQLPRYTTAARPVATVGAGACYYDTTVNKPVFSDGTTWRDALGTAV